MTSTPPALGRTAKLVATAFAVNGVVHLVRPQVYEPAMPEWLPAHRELIVWSGYAELACAAGLALPRTRRAAALAGTGLLLAVYPANVQMAIDAQATSKPAWKIGTLARLPLQWPMIRAMWRTWRAA